VAAAKLRSIPLAQLLEPERAARLVIDEGALESLASSIRATGLIEPLVVRPRGEDRFEVIAGHRRLLALKRIGAAVADCIIRSGDDLVDAVRIHENLERAELAPVDEAVYYHALYDELGQDTDKVAERVRKSRDYVERRLLLLSVHEVVLQALREGKLSLGVAEELGKLERAEDAALRRRAATRGGCSVRQARTREQGTLERRCWPRRPPAATKGPWPRGAPGPHGAPLRVHGLPSELSAAATARRCLFCGSEHEEFRMFVKHVCEPCADRHWYGPCKSNSRRRRQEGVSDVEALQRAMLARRTEPLRVLVPRALSRALARAARAAFTMVWELPLVRRGRPGFLFTDRLPKR
jgi:ParB/RepB/Spo0J family partition protein